LESVHGWLKVRLADGTVGYVSKAWVIETESTPTSGGTGTTTTTPTGVQPLTGSELIAALTAARKEAVGPPLVVNGTEVCGPTGDATDATKIDLNKNKNRTDMPGDADYVSIGWQDLKDLPKSQVGALQGAPVTVTGYLSHKINVENQGSGESTNCHLLLANEVDWHIYLTESPAQQIADAVVVETTPRSRPLHKWTTAMLHPLVDATTQVRVSGLCDVRHRTHRCDRNTAGDGLGGSSNYQDRSARERAVVRSRCRSVGTR
jgi:hypothetical protein